MMEDAEIDGGEHRLIVAVVGDVAEVPVAAALLVCRSTKSLERETEDTCADCSAAAALAAPMVFTQDVGPRTRCMDGSPDNIDDNGS